MKGETMFSLKKRTQKQHNALVSEAISNNSSEVTPGYEGLTLYHRKTCPFCRYVASYLKSKQLVLATRDITMRAAYAEELIKQGGKRQVPCLRIEQGSKVKWLYESADIVAYIEKYKPA
jgi:glutaredoxin